MAHVVEPRKANNPLRRTVTTDTDPSRHLENTPLPGRGDPQRIEPTYQRTLERLAIPLHQGSQHEASPPLMHRRGEGGRRSQAIPDSPLFKVLWIQVVSQPGCGSLHRVDNAMP